MPAIACRLDACANSASGRRSSVSRFTASPSSNCARSSKGDRTAKSARPSPPRSVTTTAWTDSSSRAGSRNGPAGSSQRLPSPRARVDNGDFVVACQSHVLEPVIADDDLRALLGRETRRRHPIRADHHRVHATPRMHQRLVARDTRIVRRRHDPGRTAMRSAVATQDHADPPAASLELTCEPGGDGCLAGAADRQVADDDDRHADVFDAKQAAAIRQAHATRGSCGTAVPAATAAGCARRGRTRRSAAARRATCVSR